MRLLIFGGREYGFTIVRTSRHPVIRLKPQEIRNMFEALDAMHTCEPIDMVVEGCAPGADTLGGIWAASRGIPIAEYPADWDGDKASAGPRRNRRQAKEGKPDMGARFGGGSGSDDMEQVLRAMGARVVIR